MAISSLGFNALIAAVRAAILPKDPSIPSETPFDTIVCDSLFDDSISNDSIFYDSISNNSFFDTKN